MRLGTTESPELERNIHINVIRWHYLTRARCLPHRGHEVTEENISLDSANKAYATPLPKAV